MSGNLIMTVVIDVRRYHRMKEVCVATRHMMDDGLIVEEHKVNGTQLLIYILYIFIHRCIHFFAILVSQVRCYCNLYLLSFIVIMYWTNFCTNYIQIVAFLYIILRVIILFYCLCQ